MRVQQEVRVGVFERLPHADRAVHRLVEAGFPKGSISVICPTCAEDVAGAESVDPAGTHTRAAALTGGAIGSVLGGLTAAVGIVASGGVGLLVVGPILGAAAAGGVTGGFLGAMTTRGLEPEIADYYDQALERGQILVAVEWTAEGPPLARAEEILAAEGADPFTLSKD